MPRLVGDQLERKLKTENRNLAALHEFRTQFNTQESNNVFLDDYWNTQLKWYTAKFALRSTTYCLQHIFSLGNSAGLGKFAYVLVFLSPHTVEEASLLFFEKYDEKALTKLENDLNLVRLPR